MRISERRQFASKINARNNNNLVQLKYAPTPSSPPPFATFLCNARSVRCKAAQIRNLIIDNDIDILVITETWLSPQDDVILGRITPEGYSALHQGRENRGGGGVAIVHKNAVSVDIKKRA